MSTDSWMDKEDVVGDFPGGPVVKNPSCNPWDVDLILIGELRSHMAQGT